MEAFQVHSIDDFVARSALHLTIFALATRFWLVGSVLMICLHQSSAVTGAEPERIKAQIAAQEVPSNAKTIDSLTSISWYPERSPDRDGDVTQKLRNESHNNCAIRHCSIDFSFRGGHAYATECARG